MTLIERVTDLDNFESERFLYRHATEEDAADMFEMFHNPEVLKWIHVPMPESIAHTLEISIKKFHLADPLGKYVIVEKATNKMIGSIDIRPTEKNNSAGGYAESRLLGTRGYD